MEHNSDPKKPLLKWYEILVLVVGAVCGYYFLTWFVDWLA